VVVGGVVVGRNKCPGYCPHQDMGVPAVLSRPDCIWCRPGPESTAGAPGQGRAGNSELPPVRPSAGAPTVLSRPSPDWGSRGLMLAPAQFDILVRRHHLPPAHENSGAPAVSSPSVGVFLVVSPCP
jgi:hypothetical protein